MDTSKIIKGVVNSGRYTVTAPIIKEDYGLYLQIEGVELPQTYEVDFSNSEHNGTSVTMIGNADGVLIPHQFIDTGKDIFAFLYHVGANYGRTVYKFRIPNKCRPDRTNEQPTPEEQSVIDQAISALNTAVAQTAQDKADADVSAQNASADAERAEEAKTDAQNFATQAEQARDDAQTYANNASASATASANSASASAQIKADVEDLVDDAQASADASERSASNAYTYATSAERSSINASASAQSASQYASQAQSSAQTASTKAQDASGYAQTASQKATESAQSATNASQSAQTALQAKTDAQTAQWLAESARDSAISAQESAEDARDEAQTIVDGISGKVDQIDANTADIESLEEDRYKPYAVDSASGAVASFPDGADDIPLKSLVVDINPVQDLSNGDPSPENICPISGWTQVNVNHSDADMTNPTTITIDLGQTVYGGKLNVLSGVLRVERKCIDLSDVEFIRDSVGYFQSRANATIINDGKHFTSGAVASLISSQYIAKAVASVQNNNGSCGMYWYASDNRNILRIRDDRYSDAQSFMSAMVGVQLCYELAEPIEIQLDAHTINSLYGQNNIFADTGDTEVVYRADTKLFIERLTAPDSADMIADANITSGQYFMVGNTLYKATANIANGGAIVVGTNCIRKSLSEALNEINA